MYEFIPGDAGKIGFPNILGHFSCNAQLEKNHFYLHIAYTLDTLVISKYYRSIAAEVRLF